MELGSEPPDLCPGLLVSLPVKLSISQIIQKPINDL